MGRAPLVRVTQFDLSLATVSVGSTPKKPAARIWWRLLICWLMVSRALKNLKRVVPLIVRSRFSFLRRNLNVRWVVPVIRWAHSQNGAELVSDILRISARGNCYWRAGLNNHCITRVSVEVCDTEIGSVIVYVAPCPR